jgi:hypothetical protein
VSNNDALEARIAAAHARIDAALERYNADVSLGDEAAEAAYDAASNELYQAENELKDAIDASLSPMNRIPRALNAKGLFVGIMFPPGEWSEAEVTVLRGNWVCAVERDVDVFAALRRAAEKAMEAANDA